MPFTFCYHADMKSKREGSGTAHQSVEEPRFTASDVRDLAGLSYRQLNDWEARGTAPTTRGSGAGWRRFTGQQMFALMVCAELRQRFGIPVERLRFISDTLARAEAGHYEEATDLGSNSTPTWLVTDLSRWLDVHAGRNLAEKIAERLDDPVIDGALLWLNVSPLVTRLLSFGAPVSESGNTKGVAK